MRMCYKFIFGILLLTSISVASASDKCAKKAQYKFKKGDTLESVFRELHVTPIFGTLGEVAKLTKIYPDILKENGTKIPVDTILLIPFNSCSLPNTWVVENNFLKKVESQPLNAEVPSQSVQVVNPVAASEELITTIVSPTQVSWNYKKKSPEELYEEEELNMFAAGENLDDLVIQTVRFSENSIWNVSVSVKLASEFTQSPQQPSYSYMP